MLLLPIALQVLAFFPFPRVGVPNLAHQEMAYDGTTAISVSRCGFSPSNEISVAHVGYSPSYELTAAHVGSTPSFEVSTVHFDASLLFEDRMCRVDPAVWYESGGVEPSVVLPLFFIPRIFASFMSLVCLLASYLFGLCTLMPFSIVATLFVGLYSLVFTGLRAMVLVGLYGLVFIVGTILLLAGGLGIMINLTFELAFMFLAGLVFCGLCSCVFIVFTGYTLCSVFGLHGTPLLALYLASYCASSSTPVLDFGTFFYYSYLTCVNSGVVGHRSYFELVARTGVWFSKVFEAIHDIYHFFWRPFFFYGLCTLLFVYCFVDSLFSEGLCFTISPSVHARSLYRQLLHSFRRVKKL